MHLCLHRALGGACQHTLIQGPESVVAVQPVDDARWCHSHSTRCNFVVDRSDLLAKQAMLHSKLEVNVRARSLGC